MYVTAWYTHLSKHVKPCKTRVVNDLILMASFMKPFRASGNKLLHLIGARKDIAVRVSQEFKNDLGKFARLVHMARSGIPLVDMASKQGHVPGQSCFPEQERRQRCGLH
jgi:hypothetical protein